MPPSALGIRAAEKLVQENPDDASAHAQLAFAGFVRIGLNEAVLGEVQTALELDELEPLANTIMALKSLSDDQVDRSLEHLQIAQDRGDQNPFFLRVQARALEANGQLNETEDILKLLAAKYPLEKEHTELLLQFYDHHAPESEAIPRLLQELAAQDYDDIPSRKRLAKHFANRNDEHKTQYWANEAIAVDALDIEMHRILAHSLHRSNDFEAAEFAYSNVILLERPTVDDRLGYAQLLRKNKKNELAAMQLREILSESPEHNEAKSLLKLIESGL